MLILVMTTPVALAQRNPEANNRLRNVSSFLATFIDPDNSTSYLDDVITLPQCKRRDLFLLHDLKDSIGDQMLDNFRTITNAELEELKTQYALLDSELTFVRNMTSMDTDMLYQVVINKAKRNYLIPVRNEFDVWVERYESRLGEDGEYENCYNSWQSVKEKWIGLSEDIESIKTEWKSLKDTFKREEGTSFFRGLGNSLRDGVVNSASNSYRTVRDGAIDSYLETRDNFRAEVAELRDDLAAIRLSKEDDYQRAVEFEQSLQGDRESLANILEEEDSLTAIPGILREIDTNAEIQQVEAMDNLVIELTTGFTDNLTVVLWDEVLKLNETITDTNTLLSEEGTGLRDIAKQVADNQCRL